MDERPPRETGCERAGHAGLCTQRHTLDQDTATSRTLYRAPDPDARHSLMILNEDWILRDPRSTHCLGCVLRPVPLAEGTLGQVKMKRRHSSSVLSCTRRVRTLWCQARNQIPLRDHGIGRSTSEGDEDMGQGGMCHKEA